LPAQVVSAGLLVVLVETLNQDLLRLHPQLSDISSQWFAMAMKLGIVVLAYSASVAL